MPWLPESVSTFGSDVDFIFYVILAITGVIFVAVETTLLYFVFRYRHREGRHADYIHGNNVAEIIWTAVPFGIVLVLGLLSAGPWRTVKSPDLPQDALHLEVTASQFEWMITYPGPDGELGTDDDFQRRNQLHVPEGRAVVVHLTSEDVIHSFFLPEFRVKQDVVPGMRLSAWFEATSTGEYVLACAELCGTGHTTMAASVTVHGAAEFEDWQATESGAAAN